MRTKDKPHKTFETWFFEVATSAERQLSDEEQAHAYEMWLTQETAWLATTEELDDFDDFGNPPDFGKIH